MKLVFAGTPEFAAVALTALAAAGHEIVLVLTQPDRPAGRGMQLQASPVKRWAEAQGVPVAQPRSLRHDGRYPDDAAAAHTLLQATPHDAMVVAAYGLILPQWVLDLSPQGCLNIHGSLLPRWRGAAPIHRALAAGDAETGITIMRMDAGLDTGPMLLVRRLPITADDTTASLHDKLATLGGAAMVDALAGLATGALVAQAQPDAGVTYADKVTRADGVLDWRDTAERLARQVRAFGASAQLQGQPVKIHAARLMEGLGAADAAAADAGATPLPGAVLAAGREGILVACGAGALCITELQKAGGKRLAARDFLAGHPLPTGAHFDLPATS